MKKPLFLFTLSIAVLMTISSCKKKSDDETPTTNPCNFTTNVIVVDGTTKNIIATDCKDNGSNYLSEQKTDTSSTPEAIVMAFNGTASPAPGTYTAVNDIALVTANTVYVEYYTATDAFQPSTGTVTVTASGSAKNFTFCDLSFTQSGSNLKKISIRATCN